MTRLLSAVRLHFVGWRTRFGWPWATLMLAFAANLAIFTAIGDDLGDRAVTGGLISIFAVEFAFCVQSMTQLMPLALSLSLTRHTFYLANAIVMVTRAVAYAVVLWACNLVEDATGGWGISLHFFGLAGLSQDGAVQQILTYAAAFIVVSYVGILTGAVFKRWGVTAIFLLALAVTVLLGAAMVLALSHARAVIDWFAGQSALTLVIGLPLVVALVLALAAYPVLRRTTP
jgi:hypothetical protein